MCIAIEHSHGLRQHRRPWLQLRGEHGVGAGECAGGAFLDAASAGEGREREASEVGDGQIVDG